MSELNKFFIRQNAESASVTLACRLVTDDDPQIQLIPGEWVKVATCASGKHVLRIGAILGSGKQWVTLELQGGTYNQSDKIEDLFYSPTDGSRYDIEVVK